MEVSKEYIPSMAIGFKSPKLTVHVEDGAKFMEKNEEEFDVIITDSSDPIGKKCVEGVLKCIFFHNSSFKI